MLKGQYRKGQSRETDNIGYTRRRKTKQKKTRYVLDTTIRKQTQTIISTCCGNRREMKKKILKRSLVQSEQLL